MTLYKLVGTNNPGDDWTAEVVLERDESGAVKKAIGVNQAADLSANTRDQLESQGFVLEKVTKDEAEALESSSPQVGADAATAAPIFDQPVTDN